MPFIFAEKCFPAVNDYILKATFKIGGKKKKTHHHFVPFLLLSEILFYMIMAGVVLSVTLSNSMLVSTGNMIQKSIRKSLSSR